MYDKEKVDGTVTTVDGRNRAPVEVGRLSHYLQGLGYIPGGCLRFLPSIVCINLYGPFTFLPFACRAIYFDSQVPPKFRYWKLRMMETPSAGIFFRAENLR